MAKHRNYSIEFERQVAQEYIAAQFPVVLGRVLIKRERDTCWVEDILPGVGDRLALGIESARPARDDLQRLCAINYFASLDRNAPLN